MSPPPWPTCSAWAPRMHLCPTVPLVLNRVPGLWELAGPVNTGVLVTCAQGNPSSEAEEQAFQSCLQTLGGDTSGGPYCLEVHGRTSLTPWLHLLPPHPPPPPHCLASLPDQSVNTQALALGSFSEGPAPGPAPSPHRPLPWPLCIPGVLRKTHPAVW